MKSLRSKISLIGLFLFAGAFALQGCSDSSTGADDSAAVFNGSVDAGPTTNNSLDGTPSNTSPMVVSAARITSDGSFETISGTSVETNASGQFTLEVDMNAAQYLAIVAENGEQTFSTVISSRAENGVSYNIQPISAETSARSAVYARIVSNHNAQLVTRADLESAISAQLAVAVNSSATVRNQVAAGLSAAAEARAAYVAEAQSNSSDIIASANSQRFQAYTQLEAALHSGVTDQTREAALRTFLEASAQAWVDAGLNESQVSAMAHLESRTMINSTSGASEQARNAVRARTAWYASIAADLGAQAEASAAGFSSATIDAIAQAGTSLKAEVRASSGAASEIRAHFETFHDEVRAAIESDSSTDAQIILAIDSEINASTGARAIFNAAVNGTTSATILVEAYKAFAAAVQTTVEASFEGDAARVQAMANLMMLINLGY